MTSTLDAPAFTKSTIYEALAAVMADVKAVGKDSRNLQHNFNFRGIDAVVNAANPALVKHGVIVVPELLKKEYGTVEVGKNRTRMAHCQVEVCYRFYGPDGSNIPVTVPGEAMDSGDKATAKAMSVAFRTALIQALALPTDEPDPDANSYERSAATDRAWLTDVERRIAEAAHPDQLQQVSHELDAKRDSGECEDDQYERLWQLGESRYHELVRAMQQQQRPPAQPTPAPAAAPAQPAQQSVRGGEPTDENDFEARLKAAKDLSTLDALKGDVMAAFKAQKLDPTSGNSLLRSIKAKSFELEEKAR